MINQKWENIYESMVILWEKDQSSSQIKKKSKKKSETAEKGLSVERMQELSKHDASREIRSRVAKKMFHKETSSLSDSEKDKLNNEMDKMTTKKKVEKLADIKFQEKKLKQDAKMLKKDAKLVKDVTKREEMLAQAESLEAKAKAKRDSYSEEKPKEEKTETPKKDTEEKPKEKTIKK